MRPNKSLDASGGSASRNLLGSARGALIRPAASTQPLGCFARTQRQSAVTFGQHREIYLAVKRIHIAAVVVCALIWTACGGAVQTSGQNGGAAGDDSPIGRAFK